MDMERVKTLLNNAITLIADEIAEQYNDTDEWYEMIYNELGTTKEELNELGIILS